MKRIHSLAIACSIAAAPQGMVAHAAPQLRLPPADAKLDEEFTIIGSVRELSDGRVLITDAREGRVVVADFRTGVVKPVGRKGQGPGEYGNGWPLYPIAGDSSIMFDLQSRRWLVLNGTAIVTTMPPDAPIILATKGSARGTDGRGRVWTIASPTQFDESKSKPGSIDVGAADSEFVVLGNRTTGKLDTVAKVRAAPMRQTVTTNAQGNFQSVSWARPPYSVGEEAALFMDGWMAIARMDPYRVDWISPEGRVTKGRAIAVPQIRLSAAERDAYDERRRAANPTPSRNMIPSLRADAAALRDEFPEFVPPFTARGLTPGGDGTLWLRKQVSKDFLEPRYDVVDRTGTLRGVVSLVKNERIVAVSRTAVYVVWKDGDDIERLRRHPVPR